MAKLLTPLERVSDKLSTIHTAMDALFKHTTKAVDIRTKADRTTQLNSQQLAAAQRAVNWIPALHAADEFFRFGTLSSEASTTFGSEHC